MSKSDSLFGISRSFCDGKLSLLTDAISGSSSTIPSSTKAHHHIVEENQKAKEQCATNFSNDCPNTSAYENARPTSKHVKNEDDVDEFLACRLCQFCCDSRQDLILHHRTDWHRQNVRRKASGKTGLSEEDFEQLSSDEENNCDDSDSEIDEEYSDLHTFIKQSSHMYITQEFGNERSVCSIYKCLLQQKPAAQEKFDIGLALMDLCTKRCNWIVMLLAGGRFAGACFKGDTVVVHKTFVRYTVRAKQGGSQGTQDKSKFAKSAGANLRRYNEAALAEDIRNLMAEWKGEIDAADCIFLRCASYHRSIFFGEINGSILGKKDARILSIPFPSHRPTFEEVKRVHRKLSTVVNHGPLEDFLRHLSDRQSETRQKRKTPTLQKAKASPDLPLTEDWNSEEENSESSPKKTEKKKNFSPGKTSTLVEADKELEPVLPKEVCQKMYTAIAKGLPENLRELISDLPELAVNQYLNWKFGERKQTFLHISAAKGNCAMVEALLNLGCDPTIPSGDNLVPFQLCSDKLVRRTFTEFRRQFPTEWEWNRAQVPEPLSPEEEAERQRKATEKKKAARAIQKKKQKERKAIEEEQKKINEQKQAYLSLSDGEKRALAAERRILKDLEEKGETLPVFSRCFQCAKDMTGLVPFEYSENRFCGMGCLKEHRAKIKSAG